ncbi:MAG TPA: hypothetical protein VGG46_03815 [Terriglobales bacterium]
MIELQHISVKLLLQEQQGIDLAALVPVFHGWIQQQSFDELLIDVADYRHVPDGPGVMVIGNEADYSVDNSDGRLGVRYHRKAVLNSSNQDRLRQAAKAAIAACLRLEEDTALNQKFRFNGRDVEIVVNDRLLAPNRPETRQAIEPGIRALADKLFGAGAYQLSWQIDPRRMLSASLKASESFTAKVLFQRM